MTTFTTSAETLLDCPACGKPIIGQVAYAADLQDASPDGTRLAVLKPVGLTVHHDCAVKTPRDGGLDR